MIKDIAIITIAVAVLTILILVATGVIKLNFKSQKSFWKCTETGCETDNEGDYTNKNICEENCNKNDEQLQQMSTQQINPSEENKLNAWACTKNNTCVKAEQGYTTEELCKQNCSTNYSNYYYPNYYYPQSLVSPYYYYRKPYINFKPRWSPRYRGYRKNRRK